MLKNIFDCASYISALSVTIPILAGIIRFRFLDNVLKVLFVYLLVSFATEGVGFVFFRNNEPDYIIRNLFAVIECTLFSALYFLHFSPRKRKVAVLISYLAFSLVTVFILTKGGGIYTQNSFVASAEGMLMIIYSSYYLYLSSVDDEILFKLNDLYFTWINYSVLSYFGMSLFFFLSDGLIEKLDVQTFYAIYSLHLITNITFNILLFIAIWKAKIK